MNPTPDIPAPSGPWPNLRWPDRCRRALAELTARHELTPEQAAYVGALLSENRGPAGWDRDRRRRVRDELAAKGLDSLTRDVLLAVAEFGSVEAYIAHVQDQVATAGPGRGEGAADA